MNPVVERVQLPWKILKERRLHAGDFYFLALLRVCPWLINFKRIALCSLVDQRLNIYEPRLRPCQTFINCVVGRRVFLGFLGLFLLALRPLDLWQLGLADREELLRPNEHHLQPAHLRLTLLVLSLNQLINVVKVRLRYHSQVELPDRLVPDDAGPKLFHLLVAHQRHRYFQHLNCIVEFKEFH